MKRPEGPSRTGSSGSQGPRREAEPQRVRAEKSPGRRSTLESWEEYQDRRLQSEEQQLEMDPADMEARGAVLDSYGKALAEKIKVTLEGKSSEELHDRIIDAGADKSREVVQESEGYWKKFIKGYKHAKRSVGYWGNVSSPWTTLKITGNVEQFPVKDMKEFFEYMVSDRETYQHNIFEGLDTLEFNHYSHKQVEEALLADGEVCAKMKGAFPEIKKLVVGQRHAMSDERVKENLEKLGIKELQIDAAEFKSFEEFEIFLKGYNQNSGGVERLTFKEGTLFAAGVEVPDLDKVIEDLGVGIEVVLEK